MVNLQDTRSSGPLTAADLTEARRFSTGNVLHLHRATLLPAGCDQQGRYETRSRAPWHDTVPTGWDDACVIEGGMHADPVPSGSVLSMCRHRRTRASVGLALALAVVGYLAHIAWPTLG